MQAGKQPFDESILKDLKHDQLPFILITCTGGLTKLGFPQLVSCCITVGMPCQNFSNKELLYLHFIGPMGAECIASSPHTLISSRSSTVASAGPLPACQVCSALEQPGARLRIISQMAMKA